MRRAFYTHCSRNVPPSLSSRLLVRRGSFAVESWCHDSGSATACSPQDCGSVLPGQKAFGGHALQPWSVGNLWVVCRAYGLRMLMSVLVGCA